MSFKIVEFNSLEGFKSLVISGGKTPTQLRGLSHAVLSSLLSDITYTLTLDADLQSSRVTSRGLFTKTNERFITGNTKISSSPLCLDYQVYVQVTHRFFFLFVLKMICQFVLMFFCFFFVFVNRRHQTLSTRSF